MFSVAKKLELFLWQDLQYVNGIFDAELELVDVAEIRELLEENENNKEPPLLL